MQSRKTTIKKKGKGWKREGERYQIEKKESQPTIVQFTSFETNHHLIVETGEFMELYNIINKIKEPYNDIFK